VECNLPFCTNRRFIRLITFRFYQIRRPFFISFNMSEVRPADLPHVNCHWIWGPTGTGKSHCVRAFCQTRNLELFTKLAHTKRFDGYQGQPALLLEDWDEKCDTRLLKTISDRYAFRGEIKGGSIWLRPHTIFVISYFCPRDCIRDPVQCESIIRRFQIINRTVPFPVRAPDVSDFIEYMDLVDAGQLPPAPV